MTGPQVKFTFNWTIEQLKLRQIQQPVKLCVEEKLWLTYDAWDKKMISSYTVEMKALVTKHLFHFFSMIYVIQCDMRLHPPVYSKHLQRNNVWTVFIDTILYKILQQPQLPSLGSPDPINYVNKFRGFTENKMNHILFYVYQFRQPHGELLSSFNSDHIMSQILYHQASRCQHLQALYWFQLNKKLSLNMTFYILYFSAVLSGSLTVYSRQEMMSTGQNDEDSFQASWKETFGSDCETHLNVTGWFNTVEHMQIFYSFFNMFTPHNNNLLFIFAQRHSHYKVHMVFSIIQINTVVNIFDISMTFVGSMFSLSQNYLVSVFHIQTKETHVLLLDMGSEEVWVFDGPGRLAPELSRSNSLFTTSSFQCMVQGTTVGFSEEFSMKYASALAKVQSQILKDKSPLSIETPNNHCKTSFCVFEVQVQEKRKCEHFKISSVCCLYWDKRHWCVVSLFWPGFCWRVRLRTSGDSLSLCLHISHQTFLFFSIKTISCCVLVQLLCHIELGFVSDCTELSTGLPKFLWVDKKLSRFSIFGRSFCANEPNKLQALPAKSFRQVFFFSFLFFEQRKWDSTCSHTRKVCSDCFQERIFEQSKSSRLQISNRINQCSPLNPYFCVWQLFLHVQGDCIFSAASPHISYHWTDHCKCSRKILSMFKYIGKGYQRNISSQKTKACKTIYSCRVFRQRKWSEQNTKTSGNGKSCQTGWDRSFCANCQWSECHRKNPRLHTQFLGRWRRLFPWQIQKLSSFYIHLEKQQRCFLWFFHKRGWTIWTAAEWTPMQHSENGWNTGHHRYVEAMHGKYLPLFSDTSKPSITSAEFWCFSTSCSGSTSFVLLKELGGDNCWRSKTYCTRKNSTKTWIEQTNILPGTITISESGYTLPESFAFRWWPCAGVTNKDAKFFTERVQSNTQITYSCKFWAQWWCYFGQLGRKNSGVQTKNEKICFSSRHTRISQVVIWGIDQEWKWKCAVCCQCQVAGRDSQLFLCSWFTSVCLHGKQDKIGGANAVRYISTLIWCHTKGFLSFHVWQSIYHCPRFSIKSSFAANYSFPLCHKTFLGKRYQNLQIWQCFFTILF